MQIQEKLVTVGQIKNLTGIIQANISETAGAAEDNAEDIAALQTASAAHATDIAALQAADNAIRQEMAASVATMGEFKAYLGIEDENEEENQDGSNGD